MDNEQVSKRLVRLAKSLVAKPEIDFQDIAKKLDSIIDEIDSHMNVYQKDYDRVDASQIDKATRQLMSVKKVFEKMEAYDEDPFG